jgi:hypothetical protein
MNVGDPSQVCSLANIPRNLPASQTGHPNVVVREAFFNFFHKITATTSTFSHSNGYVGQELNKWWLSVKSVMGTAVGSTKAMDADDFLTYMINVTELYSLYYSLLSMKMIVDMDWEGVFGERTPYEFRFIEEYLGLSQFEFDANYSDYIRRIEALPCPPILKQTLADFHSPFTLNDPRS